jgi:di/tricarboxylate transporter
VERAREHLHELPLRMGDVLLVQGSAEQIAELKRGSDFLVVDATLDLPHTRKAPIAAAIMAGIIIVAVLKILPIVLAAVSGVLLMILTGCLRWREALRALDAPMIFLTAASIALSLALVTTGAADFIAHSFVAVSFGMQPEFILSGLILLMAIMANIISNSAAAVIGTPIAISIAHALGAPPQPFVLAVLFGVNMGYATPIADNCNLLVYSAGGYQFKDFVKVGVPLVIIMGIAYSFVLPQFFPLR